jgi:hypothetical protein
VSNFETIRRGDRGKRKLWTIRVEPITTAMFDEPRLSQPSLFEGAV